MAFEVAEFGGGQYCWAGLGHLVAAACGELSRAGRVRRVEAQAPVLRQDGGAFDDVLQFADVSGPVVAHQLAHVAFGQPQHIALVASLAGEEVARQERNILAALAQRHRMDREHVEAEVQVFAKAAALHVLLEVAIGRRDEADVDIAGALVADALKMALLEPAQQSFAAGNFLGPLLLGWLFDTVGRRRMIAFTYSVSAILLAVSGYLFSIGALSAQDKRSPGW